MRVLKIRLKEILKERGVTQTQLASLSGVHQSKISRLYSNKDVKELNISIIEKLAHALGITDISELMQFEEVDVK